MHRQWLWIIVCYDESVIVNHGVVCWANGCESWWIMMNQWLSIKVCYVGQWLCIMVCYAEAVGVNHGVPCWASGCESWCAMLSLWLWIMVCYDEAVAVNHR
jgi:hypothetical protein